MRAEAPVRDLRTRACTILTDASEADGATRYDETTAVVVAAAVGDAEELGGTCGDAAAAAPVNGGLAADDLVRVEAMLFDGAPVPRHRRVAPDRGHPGLRLEVGRRDAGWFGAGAG